MYQLTSEVWLDQYNECYKKIIVITPPPKEAALIAITKLFNRVKLSPFKERSPCCPQNDCLYIVMHPQNPCKMLCVGDIIQLFAYLETHGFKVNTDLTKIMFNSDVQLKNLICFITK
jgi:hypothetical protein